MSQKKTTQTPSTQKSTTPETGSDSNVDTEVTTTAQVPAEETKAETASTTEPTVESEDTEKESPKSHTETLRELYPFMTDWTDNQIQAWYQLMEDKPSPYVSESNVLVFDPIRAQRPAADWATEELEAYLRGELLAVKDQRRTELVREFRKRVPVEPAWSDNAVFEFYRRGTVPSKTSNGVWVHDITREQRHLDSWSNDEVEAWIGDEIKTNVDNAKMIAQINERFDMKLATNTAKHDLKRAFADRNAEVKNIESKSTQGSLTPMNEDFITTRLKQYYEMTKPGTFVDEATGGKAQRMLDNVFNYVFQLKGPALLEGLNRVLEFVRTHRKDVFGPSYAHRFTDLIKGNQEQQRRHINTIELFVAVTDPVKARRKQMDVKTMLRDHPADIQESLYDYFTNYAK